MSDRGMKKWAPYKSLIEHEAILNKARNETEKVSKPWISNERAEEINEVLVNYHNEIVKVTYYRNEKINVIESQILKIDQLNKKLVLLDNKSIKFNELVNLEKLD